MGRGRQMGISSRRWLSLSYYSSQDPDCLSRVFEKDISSQNSCDYSGK